MKKILTAAMYKNGVADLWYLEYVEERLDVNWDEYVNLAMERLANIEGKNLVAPIVEMFNPNTLSAATQLAKKNSSCW